MSLVRKEARPHVGMLYLENKPCFHPRSHVKRHTVSCRPVPQLRGAFWRILMRLLPTVQGVMADLWPCLTTLLSSCCATSQIRLQLLCRQQAAIIQSSPRVWKEGNDCGWKGIRRSQKVTKQTTFWYFSLKKHGCNVCSLKRRIKAHCRARPSYSKTMKTLVSRTSVDGHTKG